MKTDIVARLRALSQRMGRSLSCDVLDVVEESADTLEELLKLREVVMDWRQKRESLSGDCRELHISGSLNHTHLWCYELGRRESKLRDYANELYKKDKQRWEAAGCLRKLESDVACDVDALEARS